MQRPRRDLFAPQGLPSGREPASPRALLWEQGWEQPSVQRLQVRFHLRLAWLLASRAAR